MITGLSLFAADVSEKLLELLISVQPKLKRVGYLHNSTNVNRVMQMNGVKRSAAQFAIDAHIAPVTVPEELDDAIARLASEGAQALIVLSSSLFIQEQRRIVSNALARKWVVVAADPGFAEAGALIAYFTDPAARETQRVIARISGRLPPDPNLQPMPFFSWESAKDIFTMGGRFTLIGHDDEGNVQVGAAFWAMFVAAIGMITMVLLFARAGLNGVS